MTIKIYSFFFLLMITLCACQAQTPIPNPINIPQSSTTPSPLASLPTETPIEKPTLENIKLINTISLKEWPEFKNYSRVTLEDFTSGRLLELEKKWLEENPFPENAVPIKTMKLFKGYTIQTSSKNSETRDLFKIDTNNVMFVMGFDYSDRSIRPMKIISYYVLWDEKLFKSLGITDQVLLENAKYGVKKENKFAKLGIVSWAWLNPDRPTTIGHTLVDLGSTSIINNEKDRILMPLIDAYNSIEYLPNSTIDDTKILLKIYSLYPDLKPLELSKKWVSIKIMPEELQFKLFGRAPISSSW